MFLSGTLPYSIAKQYQLVEFKQYCGVVEKYVCCRIMYHQLLYTRQEENGRICIPLRLCVYPVGWSCGAVLLKFIYSYLWMVTCILYIESWFGLEGTFKGHLIQPPCNEQGLRVVVFAFQCQTASSKAQRTPLRFSWLLGREPKEHREGHFFLGCS